MLFKRHIFLTLIFALPNISACGDSETTIVDARTKSQPSVSSVDLANAKPWQGKVRGYTAPVGAENSRIATTIKIGDILSAAELYNDIGAQVSRDTISDIAILEVIGLKLGELIGAELIELYGSFQSNFSEKDNRRVEVLVLPN